MYFTGTKCQLLLISCLLSLSAVARDAKSMVGGGFQKPLCFVENKGQVRTMGTTRNDVQFQLYGNGVDVFVGNGTLHYQFKGSTNGDRKTCLMDVKLLGGNTACAVEPADDNAYYENYFLTGLPQEGVTAHAWNKLVYKNVYNDIDWVLYVKDGHLEYDFVVRPGGNVNDIRIAYNGTRKMSIDANGALVATNPLGEVTEHRPYSFGSNGTEIASAFTLNGNVVGFTTGSYTGTLTIDPYLSWATYYGGSNEDVITAVTTSSAGDIYACGYTYSTNLTTTTGVLQATASTGGGTEAFIVKYNSSGSLQFATYFGGTRNDAATAICYDNSTSNLFVVGNTNSNGLQSSFSVNKPFFSTGTGDDMFLLKLNNTGTTRGYSTYIGGTSNDHATSVASDGTNVIVGGFVSSGNTSSSPNISTDGTNLSGSQDGYLGKFSQSGTGTRVWSTYVGGTGADEIDGIVIDGSGNVTFTGQTSSAGGIATSGASQAILGGTLDAFVMSYSSTGSRRWGTYFGGSGDDMGTGITMDGAGNYYITGNTASTDSIALGYASTASFGGGTQDGFVARLSSTGTIVWGTYIGGNSDDYATGITADIYGSVVVTGYTPSTSGIATTG
ncbi:MAG: hypothetical protein EBZ77_03735, partial [Chitinophagia bacterium]|nr:hypothetical protein [Chitinophagia bacterium]